MAAKARPEAVAKGGIYTPTRIAALFTLGQRIDHTSFGKILPELLLLRVGRLRGGHRPVSRSVCTARWRVRVYSDRAALTESWASAASAIFPYRANDWAARRCS